MYGPHAEQAIVGRFERRLPCQTLPTAGRTFDPGALAQLASSQAPGPLLVNGSGLQDGIGGLILP
ncbi:hypothetical protein [Bradyrhizobium liaoningense]|uniref:hypothetical protein n=1 Tax=Bradyrhizobium liaoningense TaxID=43992 RepID=UPI001BA99E17|nr:hypothetical protein [Bradyrhizobium liaoningense]MBR0713190.1 hypothetical protein [Bradyrhizobium liaoningense]